MISLSSYWDSGGDVEELGKRPEHTPLASSLRQACEEVGFFLVADHGVPLELMQSLRNECLAFFSHPPQSLILQMVDRAQSDFFWLDYLQTEGSPGWSLGPAADRGSLPWQLPQAFQDIWLAYYALMERLCRGVLELLALSLDLPAKIFEAPLRGHASSMRALLYPEISEETLAKAGGEVVRSPEHADWGCITVLLPDPEVGGLEIQSQDGAWIPLMAQPNTLVINLGELLPFWTGGKLRATPHRVIARQRTRASRLSIAYFGLVNRATVLKPLKGCEEEGAAYVTAGEFFNRHEELSRKIRPERDP